MVRLLILLIIPVNSLLAQSFIPKSLLSQSSFYQWTGENGLISNNITSCIQARSGFIWITTYNGIMRFDGTKVDIFDRSQLPFLSTDAFYKVYEDPKGNLWFASQGSGLIKYDNYQFSKVSPENDSLPKSIRCIFFEDDIVWIGSNSDGLFKLEKNKLSKISHPSLDHIGVLDISKDAEDNLWIASDGAGLFKYHENTFEVFTTKDGLFSDLINTLLIEKNGMWIGTTSGVNFLSNGVIQKKTFLENIAVNFITQDSRNRIWFGTESGLGKIENNEEDFVGEENGLPFVRINDIAFDNEGSAWISTGRNGLIQIKSTGILNLTTTTGLSLDRINIVSESKDKTFYIGTDDGHVDTYNNGEIKNIPIKTDLNKAGIRDVLKDDDGSLWIGSYKGLLKISDGKEYLYTTKDGLPSNDVRRILKDNRGRLWIGTRSGGVAQLVNDKVTRILNKENGLESNYILSIEQDSKGKIYIGTHSGGLSIVQEDDSIITHHITKNDAGILIFNIHIDSTDRVFTICNMGPFFFDGKNFKPIKFHVNAKGETYFDWLEARETIWITTNIGVLSFKKHELASYLEGNISVIPTKLYNNQDGMRNKECTGATRSMVSSSGKLWIPTVGGVSVFYPDLIEENKIAPPVYVMKVTTDNESIPRNNSNEIVIPAGNLRVGIHFTALSYLSPSKMEFKYMLKGVDRKWQEVGNVREAEYTNLSPGKYDFIVLASNNDNVWNETGDTLTLVVQPFFYQTTLFYILTSSFTILLLVSIYKWRVDRIEKRNAELKKLNEELDRFVYSTSHDLRAPLASIMGLITLSRIENENRDEYLDLIEKSVTKLDQFISEIIDYSRNSRLDLEVKKIDFENLIESLLDDLKFLDQRNVIKKEIEINGSGEFCSDVLRLKIVLNNLVSNALKYSNLDQSSPFVKIIINYSDKEAEIKIIDNGIGINAKHLPNIFKMFYRGSEQSRGSGLGLYIVEETVTKLKGEITVKSVLGEGSEFTIHLPSISNH